MQEPNNNGIDWLLHWLSMHAADIYAMCAAAITHFVQHSFDDHVVYRQLIKDSLFIGFIALCLTPMLTPILDYYGLGQNTGAGIGCCLGLLGPNNIRTALKNLVTSWVESPFQGVKDALTAIKNWFNKRSKKDGK